MAPSNEGNEGNEGNVGAIGRVGGGGFGLLPDRVDLPFITEGKVAQAILPVQIWNDRFWAGDWSAWRMLIDFAQVATLPYARPPLRVVEAPAGHSVPAGASCTLDAATPALADACVGIYEVRCVKAPTATTNGVMRLRAPSGRLVVDRSFPSGAGDILFADELKFKVTQGGTDFSERTGFDIKVEAWGVTVQSVGNTGNGTCVVDPIPLLGVWQLGRYRVRCTAIAPNTTFQLRGPNGNVLQTANIGGGFAQFNTHVQFKVNQVGTAFAVGDSFDLTVERLVWLDEPVKLRTGPVLTVTVDTQVPPSHDERIVMDPISPTRSDTVPGVYVLAWKDATGNGRFDFTGPGGFSTVVALNAGPTVVAQKLYLTMDPGSTGFGNGDTFTITVEDVTATFPERELKALVRLAEDERPDALGEILAQSDGFSSYFMAALGVSPRTHPNTCLLLQIGSLIGCYGSMHFKNLYQRRRPSQLAPGLMPPIPVPGHPSYPSGHSTQAHLMALCVGQGLPAGPIRNKLGEVIDELADRIARNREIAGLHFQSDSKAGANLALSLFELLKSNALPVTVPQPIPPAIPASTARRFQSIIDDARTEWA
jgi:hypothetical protein